MTIISAPSDAAPAVLDLLREARLPETSFAALDAGTGESLRNRFRDTRSETVPGTGRLHLAGKLWARIASAQEPVTDVLYRHGVDPTDAERLEQSLRDDLRLTVVVDDPQIDVAGLKLALQRQPHVEVIEARVGHPPAGDRVPEGTRAEVRLGDVRGFARGGSRDA